MDWLRNFAARYGPFALAGTLALGLAACASQATQRPAAVEIEVDGPRAAERLSEAIRIKTISESGEDSVTPVEAFAELHEFLKMRFPAAHTALKREVVKREMDKGEVVDTPSLLYTWEGSDPSKAPILLAAHMDVVPVEKGTEDKWLVDDPYAGTIDAEGMIWGRGALDDKLSVLGLLEAVEVLLRQGFKPQRTIYLGFGHDEELEGEGAMAIAAELEKRGQPLAYVLDEGSIIGVGLVPGVDKPVAMIGVAEKGYLSIELIAKSEGGHSSIPPEETSIGRLARALDRLQNNPLPAEIRPPVSDMLAALAPEMSTVQGLAMENQWLFGGIITSMLTDAPTSNAMVRTTTAPTIIEGGTKDNVLPQEAKATVNFRILPDDSIESVVRHVKEAIDDPEIEVAPIMASASEPVPPADIGSESYGMVERTVQEIFPQAVVAPALVIAATDSRHYQNVTDNIFRFLPVTLDSDRLAGMHGNNERLETSSYERLIAFYVRLMRNSQLMGNSVS